MDFPTFAVAEARYAAGLRLRRHAHDYSNVTIVTAGQIEECAEGGEYRAWPSSVVVKAAGCEHENRVSGRGAAALTIRFDAGSPFGKLIGGRAWTWLDEPSIVRDALALQRAFARQDEADVERSAVALIESVVAAHDTNGDEPAWIDAIRNILDARFDESDLRFDNLARDFGLHPVYASRAFRRHTGVSMRGFVRARRLRSARRELSSTRRNIGAIAQQSGFADASHLARTFARELGVTPKTYRVLTRG
ncbi:MAG TPA: helix-turn-helix transcriptional regulator [Thermoanaerobaculia bacterium]|nr:helix-turn-helix transcriptional regulator [Thermoanaerobaculia bacterium]